MLIYISDEKQNLKVRNRIHIFVLPELFKQCKVDIYIKFNMCRNVTIDLTFSYLQASTYWICLFIQQLLPAFILNGIFLPYYTFSILLFFK